MGVASSSFKLKKDLKNKEQKSQNNQQIKFSGPFGLQSTGLYSKSFKGSSSFKFLENSACATPCKVEVEEFSDE